jgi:hypothetical protein
MNFDVRLRLRLAAAVTAASGIIHVSASAEHYREWWVFCVLFAVTAALQLGWAVVVWRGGSNSLLAAGAVLNLGIAAVWVWSRTRGLPVGPEAFHPEEIGIADAQSTVDEVLAAALVATTLALPLGRARRHLTPLAEALAIGAVFMSFMVLATGAGHHG